MSNLLTYVQPVLVLLTEVLIKSAAEIHRHFGGGFGFSLEAGKRDHHMSNQAFITRISGHGSPKQYEIEAEWAPGA